MEIPSLSIRVLDVGAVLDERYEIAEKIATGGMATVYRALDRQDGKKEVALKVLHKDLALDKTYVQRFVKEVKLIHGIDHPNIVRSFDIGTEDGMIYYTMEFVRGQTLEQLMEQKSFTTDEISRLIVDICRGLSVVHALGIIHRDLKPANILIAEDGATKIVDFGVARDKSSRLTQPNQTIGSVCYIAPEMWLGKKPTPAVDFYSLGIMLYEMVTGDVPFDDPLPGQMLELHLNGRVIPPWQKNKEVPKWLNDLILKLLEKQPKDRPRNALSIIELVDTERLRAESGRVKVRDDEQAPVVNGQAAVNVTASGTITPIRLGSQGERGKTYVFRLRATQVYEEAALQEKTRPRRKATVVIPLPRRSALVLEIEAPSRDVIAFGVFLASLQVADGVLTSVGVSTWGLHAEGNPVLRTLMHYVGPHNAIVIAKCFAIVAVVFLTNVARKKKLFRDLIGAMTCLYLFAAIIPWVYFLSKHFSH